MPERWSSLAFRICYKKKWLYFEFTEKAIKITAEGKEHKKLLLNISGKKINLTPGKTRLIKNYNG
jgi:trehalose/maltose hydrolase-like predicted phosphorylase